MHKAIADVAKSLWQAGPVGKLGAVVMVVLAALALGLIRYGISHSGQLARESGLACGLGPEAVPKRAVETVQQLGLATTETTWQGNRAWQVGEVTVALLEMRSPCDTALVLRASISDAWPADAPMDTLEAYDVRRSFETGGASFVCGGPGQPAELVRSLPLAQTPPSTLRFEVEELSGIAAQWRQVWLAQALRIRAGQEPPPRTMQFRPGKDPETRLREVEAFLRDAGVRRRDAW
jgi:hypothetical protein